MEEDKIDENKGKILDEDNVDNVNADTINSFEDEIHHKEKRNWFQLYLKVLAVISGVCMFGGIATLGLFSDKQWLLFVIVGWAPALLLFSIAVERIVRLVKFLRHPRQSFKKVKGDVDAVVDCVKGIGEYYKSGFRMASRKHKVTCMILLVGFVLIMLFMLVGVTIANFFPQYKIVGFVCMGISGGGMVIFITSLVIAEKKSK